MPNRFSRVKGQIAFEIAPEICVEVPSPDNTTGEMEEKKTLYFEAGAEEFWICDLEGKMSFFRKGDPKHPRAQSSLALDFPGQVDA